MPAAWQEAPRPGALAPSMPPMEASKTPRNGLKLSLGGIVSGATLIAALTAAIGWASGQGRLSAQVEANSRSIEIDDQRIDKLSGSVTDLALALGKFAAATETDRSSVHAQLAAVNDRLLRLERPPK